MMEKRRELQKQEGKNKHNWFNMLPNILDVYSNQAVHRSIQMTPAEGRMQKNHSIVLANLQLRAKHNRKYPVLKKGDIVQVFKKKTKKEEKERFSHWAKQNGL